jgi:chemotaxis response regulator CheB
MTADPTGIAVLIVDDQALVRSGFRLILDSQPDITVVGEAGDGQEGLTLARSRRPDVVLMDIQMPVMDGIEATRSLMAEPGTTTRVLVLTTFDVDEYVYDAVRAGASGFPAAVPVHGRSPTRLRRPARGPRLADRPRDGGHAADRPRGDER